VNDVRLTRYKEYFVSGFTVVLPVLSTSLNIPDASRIWPASAFSLTLASSLLVFGRLADMYGGYPLYLAGLVWLALWSLIAGFSQNSLMLDFCRALQGLGPAAFLPSSMMLLGSIYRPGPRKNMVFSLYGASAPVGFFAGIFFAGLTGEYTIWGWYFWIGCLLTIVTLVTAYVSIPSDMEERRGLGVKMDWIGAALIITGLILFTFAIIDSSHAPQQWRTPYIFTLFIVGAIILFAAAYYECKVATDPLLPASLFKIPQMTALIIGLFFTYGSLGIFLLYATFYMFEIMGGSPLQIVAVSSQLSLVARRARSGR
jgi:MFS family permease